MLVKKCRNVFRLSIWNYFASFAEGLPFSFRGKGNFKFTLWEAMTAQETYGCKWVVNATLRRFIPEKVTRYQLYRMVEWVPRPENAQLDRDSSPWPSIP